MNYLLLLMICFSSNLLLGMQATDILQSRFQEIPRDIHNTIKTLLIKNDPELFKTAIPYRTYSIQIPTKTVTPETDTHETDTHEIESVCMTSDGKWGLFGTRDKVILLYDFRDPNAIRFYPLKRHLGRNCYINAIEVTPDGRWAISGGSDNTAIIWDLRDKTNITIQRLTGHKGPINAVELSDDGRWAITGSDDCTSRVWDLADPTKPRSYELRQRKQVTCVRIAADGHCALTSSVSSGYKGYGPALYWDLRDLRNIRSCTLGPGSLALTPDGAWGLTGGEEGIATLWDFNNASNIHSYLLSGHSKPFEPVIISADGKRALSMTGACIMRALESTGSWTCRCEGCMMWNLEDLTNIQQIALYEQEICATAAKRPHEGELKNLSENPPTCNSIINLQNLQKLCASGIKGSSISHLSGTPDCRWVLYARSDTAKLTDLSPADDLSLRDAIWISLNERESLPESKKDYYLGKPL